jgi:hypothetical protein
VGHRLRTTGILAAALVALPLWIGPRITHALDGDAPSLHALVASSDMIVVGKIVKTTMVDRENELSDISYNHSPRFTAVIATLQVDETIKGDPATTVKFTYPKRARITGEPVYDQGQDGVWLLRKSDKRDEYIADETGRLQPRERKEQIKAVLASFRGKKPPDDEKSP